MDMGFGLIICGGVSHEYSEFLFFVVVRGHHVGFEGNRRWIE